jgi:hypothetical protein
MTKRIYLMLFLALTGLACVNAQVRIGSGSIPNPSAVLDLNPDDLTNQGNSNLGLAMPRVNLISTTDANPLSDHVHGMTIYNMSTSNDVTPGFYYNDGTKWVRLISLDESQHAEIDGVIGNEVTDATDNSLSRAGSGTTTSPYTLAVAIGGVETKHLKYGTVTTEKIANNAITTEKIINQAITTEKIAESAITNINIADNSITVEKFGDDIWNEVRNEINNSAITEEVDGVIVNEIVGSTDKRL